MSVRSRPTWDEYFLANLQSVAERATCDRGRCACILTREHQTLVTGYVGSPPGFPHCDDVGHLMENEHCVRTVHAEQNALAQAASRGVAVRGATAYTTMVPCRTCAMMFVTIGVVRVVSEYDYQNTHGLHILTDACVKIRVMKEGQLYVP